MNEYDKNILIKEKYNPYYKNNQRKNRINLKNFIFSITILISILFILKLLKNHIFSVQKTHALKTEDQNIFLTNFSSVSKLSNNNSNDNQEHHLISNNSDYHLNYNHSEYHPNENNSDSNALLLSNKLHKNITRIDTLVLRSDFRTFGNYAIALNNAIYFCKY